MKYSSNSKRPHTVIKNILYDLKNEERKYLYERLKKVVYRVNYFSLEEIDFAILRLFVLKKLSQNKEEITKETLESASLGYEYAERINEILRTSPNKKPSIVYFLERLIREKESAIELQLLDRKDDKDLLYILKYCKI